MKANAELLLAAMVGMNREAVEKFVDSLPDANADLILAAYLSAEAKAEVARNAEREAANAVQRTLKEIAERAVRSWSHDEIQSAVRAAKSPS